MSKVKLADGKSIIIEDEHIVLKFVGLYSADPASGRRDRGPILDFIARHGGRRTVLVRDIAEVS